jgi:7-carboxy-7-deazaguanine synthase
MSTSEVSASEVPVSKLPVSEIPISEIPVSEFSASFPTPATERIIIPGRESAPVREVFCSVQGEGPYVGARQAFVRFSGCNLKCKYCDTDFANPGTCDYEPAEGSASFEKVPNPLSARQLEALLQPFKNLHSVSLTGGEPLLHADFIGKLDLSAPLYLESNMTLPEQARKIKDRVAYVAGDFKLPEALGLEKREAREDHIENTVGCFKILRTNETRDCFCKIVMSRDSDSASVLSAVDAIADYVSCVILQPETVMGGQAGGINTQSPVKTLIELQNMLLEKIDTRIIPQTHRMWGCL